MPRYKLRTLLILLAVLPPLLWVGWGKYEAWKAERERRERLRLVDAQLRLIDEAERRSSSPLPHYGGGASAAEPPDLDPLAESSITVPEEPREGELAARALWTSSRRSISCLPCTSGHSHRTETWRFRTRAPAAVRHSRRH